MAMADKIPNKTVGLKFEKIKTVKPKIIHGDNLTMKIWNQNSKDKNSAIDNFLSNEAK